MQTPVAAPMGDLTTLLNDVEWAGSRPGQRFGGEIGRPFNACPICKGIAPDQGAELEFTASAIGHQPDCRMVKGLEFVTGRNL